MLAAAWLTGVLLASTVSAGPLTPWLLAGAAGMAAFGLWLVRVPVLPAVLATLLLLGLARAEVGDGQGAATSLLGESVVATGRIVDDPETTSRQVRFELQVSHVEVEGKDRTVDERWLVYASPPNDLVSRRSSPYFRYGDEVIVEGAPVEPKPIDGFDYAAYLAAQGISATLFARNTRLVSESGPSWRAAIFVARGRLAESIERVMPYPESALGQVMLLGKRESMPPALSEQFRGTGAAHLLAISGLHVGVLLAAVAGTAAWLLGRQRPTYLAVAGAAIWLYVLAAGASPSALRAAVMGTVYLAALGLGRPSSVLPALALAAAVMTALSPGLVRQVSFQLSFAAVGGIALVLVAMGGRFSWSTSPASSWVKRLLGWAASLIIVSAAASLATWPLVAANFGQVALLGIPGLAAYCPGDTAAHRLCTGGGNGRAGVRAVGSAVGMDGGSTSRLHLRSDIGFPHMDAGGGLGRQTAAGRLVRCAWAGAVGGAARPGAPLAAGCVCRGSEDGVTFPGADRPVIRSTGKGLEFAGVFPTCTFLSQ